MSPLSVLALCVQACLIQSVLSCPTHSYNNLGSCGANRLNNGFAPAASLGALGCGAAYGGAGVGEVGVSGGVSACGSTAVAGSVPAIGAVDFSGVLPGAGSVSIDGQCGCGCSALNSPSTICNNLGSCGANRLSYGGPTTSLGALGCGAAYGGAGASQVGVSGGSALRGLSPIYNNLGSCDANRLSYVAPATSLGALGCGAAYGGAGDGVVGVSGGVSACGSTVVAGTVPTIGAVEFSGVLPGAGSVSIAGQCGCGCVC